MNLAATQGKKQAKYAKTFFAAPHLGIILQNNRKCEKASIKTT